MSSPIGLGVPSLLPVTGAWTVPFILYLTSLSAQTAMARVNSDKYLGHQTDSSVKDKSATTSSGFDPLLLLTRCHANFIENVPLCFTLAGIAELNGGNSTYLNYAMAALLVFRVCHVEIGLKRPKSRGIGRPIGYFGTSFWQVGMSVYCAYLAKGYYGY